MDWFGFVTQILPLVLAFVSGGAGLLNRRAEHPEERYGEKVEELRKNRWGEVSAALGELIVDVEESAEEDDNEKAADEPTEDAMYAVIIQKKYNRGLLTDVEDELEEYEEPVRHYQNCRKSADRMSVLLISAFLLAVISCLVALAYIFVLGNIGQTTVILVSMFPSILSIGALFVSVAFWWSWHTSRKKLD